MSPSAEASGARGKLLVALASFGVAAALLVALEGVLRVAGVGAAGARGASRLPYQRLVQPVLQPGRQADGAEVLVPADPRLPYEWVRRAKPAEGLRVLVFGGSAAAGLGYSPNVTFARHLERLLGRAAPERTVEVLNLGITALSSGQVAELVREAATRYEPDVLVVYSGNNEFLEPHARRYVLAHGGLGARAREALRDTNLARLLAGSGGAGSGGVTTAEELQAGEGALQLTQSEIIEDIALAPDEVEAVVERYGANLRAIVDVAREASTPLVLMTVASNWEWRGKEDLPAGWKDEVFADAGRPAGSDEELLALLDARLDAPGDPLRHELLFRRATLFRELGRHAQARDDLREAMNVDPHLRRALDALNERALALAGTPGVRVLDTVAFLAGRAEHGIVGFEHFYDYVHFTPKGAALVGGEVFRAIVETLELVPAGARDELAAAYVREELATLEALERDLPDARRWLGVGGDLARVHDRDLWKYQRMVEGLEAADDLDPRALVDRGNARSFRPDGADGALADWRAALAREELDAAGADAVRGNVDRLERERDVARRE